MPTYIGSVTAASLAAVLAAASAFAQDASTGSQTVDALLACRALEAAAERAACLDSRLSDFSAAIDEGRIVVVEREAVRAVERESFGIALPSVEGLSNLFARRAEPTRDAPPESEELEDGSTVVYRDRGGVQELRATPVRRVDYDPYGKIVVTLENGQVWVQTDSNRIMPVRRRHLDGLTANIERGLFGSFSMRLSHAGPSFRVQRRD